MANGTMTGTGTQIDPYLVEDVYDFCAINDSGAYSGNYFKLTVDIDFNSHATYKYGISTILFNRDKICLDGDSHEIRNMILTGTTSKLIAKEFSNISFVNIILNAIQSSAVQIRATTFNNCQFGYYCGNSSLGCIFSIPAAGTFNDCTFNISGSTYDNAMNCVLNRCHIHFNNFICSLSNESSIFRNDSTVSSSKVTFNNTYMTGKITASGRNFQYIFYGYESMTFNNSYIACEIINATDTAKYIAAGQANMQSTCFIDKTLAQISTNHPQGWYLLTTEQCKNNAYLQSIGFQAFAVESQ